MEEALGWFGNILFVVGAYLLGNRARVGFISNALANCLYIVFAIIIGSPAVITLSIVLCLVNLNGFYKWGKKC